MFLINVWKSSTYIFLAKCWIVPPGPVLEHHFNLIQGVPINIGIKVQVMARPDSQQYPWELCLIKHELDINVYNFENWLFSISMDSKKFVVRFRFYWRPPEGFYFHWRGFNNCFLKFKTLRRVCYIPLEGFRYPS